MLEVQRLANRALTLSEDFVRLAQAESKPLEMASGDQCALVLEARRDVAPQALASAITLDFVPPAGGMAIGFFDRELLQHKGSHEQRGADGNRHNDEPLDPDVALLALPRRRRSYYL